ncbi:unnamed protein product [Porites lobata]|uniref:Uncharacterized protein n=1 Tax=Porites lobata TaxID=104759 RepID=A0ABN8Q7X0_9CNID|nr:unnamed protein product [Porites lobata]
MVGNIALVKGNGSSPATPKNAPKVLWTSVPYSVQIYMHGA